MARVPHRWQGFRSRGPWLLLALPAVVATGCKSGTWGAKPSWWSFGGSTAQSSLAAAPTFEGDVTKPSEAAKPYPTTETPESYALTDATRTATASASPTPAPAATVDPTSVTYGSAPPPDAVSTPLAAAGTPAPASSIGPQVGPYASLQPAAPSAPPVDPAAAATAGFAAAPAFGQAAPPADTGGSIAGSRYADARSTDAWAASAPPPATTDSRYGTAYASRFSGGSQPPPQSAEPAFTPESVPAGGDLPQAAPNFSSPPQRPAIAPADASSLQPFAPPAAPPAPGSEVLPGTIAPPKRRPDPGYRPGGTSSYRPNRAILAGDEAVGGVMPASFEAAPPAP